MRPSAFNTSRVHESIAIATRTDGTVDGTGIDREPGSGGFRSALIVVHTGTITDGTHTVTVEHSDDNSTFTAVPDADLEGTEPAIGASDDNAVFEVGYVGYKRFLRVSITTSGATSGGTFGALILLSHAKHAPVTR